MNKNKNFFVNRDYFFRTYASGSKIECPDPIYFIRVLTLRLGTIRQIPRIYMS